MNNIERAAEYEKQAKAHHYCNQCVELEVNRVLNGLSPLANPAHSVNEHFDRYIS